MLLRTFAPKPPAETPRAFLPRSFLGVGDAIAGAANPYVLKIGDTMTGDLLASPTSTLNLGGPSNMWLGGFITNLKDSGSNNRLTIGNNTFNTYTGRAADGAAAYGHKFLVGVSLVTSGAKIAGFFSDNGTTERVFIDRIGSLIPSTDGGANLGSATARFNALNVAGIRASSANNRILLSVTSNNTYKDESADGSSAVGHVFDTLNAFVTSGAKLASFRNAGTEKVYVSKDGDLVPATANGPSLGLTGARWNTLWVSTVRQQSSTLNLIGNPADGASALGISIGVNTALTIAGSKIASFLNNSVEKLAVDKDGAVLAPSTLFLRSSVANGAGAIGLQFDTDNVLSNATAKLLSIKNQGSEYLSIAASDGGLFAVSDTPSFQGAAGTTEDARGRLARRVEKFHVDYAAFTAAAPSQDIYVAQVPAGTRIVGCYTQTTQAFAGLGGTIDASVGEIVNGALIASSDELILAHNVKVTGSKGLADADLGFALARATAVQGGVLNSLTAFTKVYVRLTSGAGNLGTGAATNLTAGQLYVWLITEALG